QRILNWKVVRRVCVLSNFESPIVYLRNSVPNSHQVPGITLVEISRAPMVGAHACVIDRIPVDVFSIYFNLDADLAEEFGRPRTNGENQLCGVELARGCRHTDLADANVPSVNYHTGANLGTESLRFGDVSQHAALDVEVAGTPFKDGFPIISHPKA